uniref:Uncharacterized protein n=1 Tax=Avena sativa TaxID=4498 RepID=A0ACD5USU6_AVESA
MEGCVLLPMRREAGCEEQQEEEDIGCPSESEMSATDSMLSSSGSGEELEDDATSSSSSGSTDNFEMASLMAQLPLKRGLSKFFDGKSQSFASLAAVGSLEDLAKPPSKRLKASRSCEVGLQDAHRRRFCRRNAAAFKKVAKGRLSVLGKAHANLTLRPVTARPQGLPGRGALLFA